jgi:hypothetical protein
MPGFKINNKSIKGIVKTNYGPDKSNYIELVLPKSFTIDDWAYFIEWENHFNDTQHVKDLAGFNPHFNMFFGCHPIIDDEKASIKLYYNHSKLIMKKRNY